jgi:hypothetical protein
MVLGKYTRFMYRTLACAIYIYFDDIWVKTRTKIDHKHQGGMIPEIQTPEENSKLRQCESKRSACPKNINLGQRFMDVSESNNVVYCKTLSRATVIHFLQQFRQLFSYFALKPPRFYCKITPKYLRFMFYCPLNRGWWRTSSFLSVLLHLHYMIIHCAPTYHSAGPL